MSHLKAKKNSKVTIPGEYFDELLKIEERMDSLRKSLLRRLVHINERHEQVRAINNSHDKFSKDEKIIGILNTTLAESKLITDEENFINKELANSRWEYNYNKIIETD